MGNARGGHPGHVHGAGMPGVPQWQCNVQLGLQNLGGNKISTGCTNLASHEKETRFQPKTPRQGKTVGDFSKQLAHKPFGKQPKRRSAKSHASWVPLLACMFCGSGVATMGKSRVATMGKSKVARVATLDMSARSGDVY